MDDAIVERENEIAKEIGYILQEYAPALNCSSNLENALNKLFWFVKDDRVNAELESKIADLETDGEGRRREISSLEIEIEQLEEEKERLEELISNLKEQIADFEEGKD